MSNSKKAPGDPSFYSREKKFSLVGTSLFIGLRAADALLQYSIFQQGWGAALVSSLGGSPVAFASPAESTLANFGLGPYPALITALALGSTLKNIVWALVIAEQEMTLSAAVVVATLNSIMNATNTLFSIWAVTSQAPALTSQSGTLYDTIAASPALIIGVTLFTVGVATELVPELQRKAFKAKPENKGKPYGGGLWSLATNINYGGHTIWRAAMALCAAGPLWGIFIGSFYTYDFATRAIPSMDVYLTEKVSYYVLYAPHDADLSNQYGADYQEIKKKTPYKLIPYIY